MDSKQKRYLMGWLMGIVCTGLSLVVFAAPAGAEAQWNVGVSGGSQGIEGFHVSIGEYYRVPEREVVVVRDRGIEEDELPVVFFLAQRAHVSPDVIVGMRLHPMSWMDITLHFGLSPEIYYVPMTVDQHPPYGHAYGYYRNHPRKTWKKMRFSDHEIVDQVNLGFLANHYRYAPERIMRYRSEGRDFTRIDQVVRQERHPHGKSKDWKDDYQGPGKGKEGKRDHKGPRFEDDQDRHDGPHR